MWGWYIKGAVNRDREKGSLNLMSAIDTMKANGHMAEKITLHNNGIKTVYTNRRDGIMRLSFLSNGDRNASYDWRLPDMSRSQTWTEIERREAIPAD